MILYGVLSRVAYFQCSLPLTWMERKLFKCAAKCLAKCSQMDSFLTHADTGRTCKFHTERPQKASGFRPRTFLLWGYSANHFTTVPPTTRRALVQIKFVCSPQVHCFSVSVQVTCLINFASTSKQWATQLYRNYGNITAKQGFRAVTSWAGQRHATPLS